MDITFSELINKRQSCRNFSERKLEKDILYRIIDKARCAPSACNSQPWRVLVCCDAEENAKMAECLQDDGKNLFLSNAQAFVAVYKAEDVKLNAGTETKFSGSHFIEYDLGEFVAYLTLAAKETGVDSCIIGWVNNDKINLNFNVEGECDLVIAFGYAADDRVRPKKRAELKDILLNHKS